MRFALLAALLIFAPPAFAQQDNGPTPPVAPVNPPTKVKPAPKLTKTQMTAVELQKTVDTLTQSNHDLLDLLQKQQAVLEDMQYDRRLQSRQIESLEERLTSTLAEKNELQNKINKLESQVSLGSTNGAQPAPHTTPAAGSDATPGTPGTVTIATEKPAPTEPPPPPKPQSYLPDPPNESAAGGEQSWHRLFTLKGDDLKQSDLFQIRGKMWRVQWHNLDRPGKAFANTSALFINAYPKDDTIPQKVCAKLGTGGDSAELQGPGNYYLKVEASGGSWELAVEEFR